MPPLTVRPVITRSEQRRFVRLPWAAMTTTSRGTLERGGALRTKTYRLYDAAV